MIEPHLDLAPSQAESLLGDDTPGFLWLTKRAGGSRLKERRGGEESIDAGSVTGIRDRFVPPATIGAAIVNRGFAPATGALQSCLCCRRPTSLPRYRATLEPPAKPGGGDWLLPLHP